MNTIGAVLRCGRRESRAALHWPRCSARQAQPSLRILKQSTSLSVDVSAIAAYAVAQDELNCRDLTAVGRPHRTTHNGRGST